MHCQNLIAINSVLQVNTYCRLLSGPRWQRPKVLVQNRRKWLFQEFFGTLVLKLRWFRWCFHELVVHRYTHVLLIVQENFVGIFWQLLVTFEPYGCSCLETKAASIAVCIQYTVCIMLDNQSNCKVGSSSTSPIGWVHIPRLLHSLAVIVPYAYM